MKKVIAATLAVALTASVALTGCSSSGGDSKQAAQSGSSSKVTLNYYTWSDEKTYIPQETAAFEKENPNIKLNTIVIPSSDYDNKIQVLLSGGSDIDIMDVRNIQSMSNYAKGGALANLSDLIKRDNYDISPYGTLYQKYAIDNVYYGLPVRGSCWMLFYNKDIFQKEGVAAPKQMTWTEFEALAKKMTHGSGTNKQYGAFMTTWIYQQMAVQKGVTLLDDNAVPALKYSLQVYNQMFNVDKSAMGVADQKAIKADCNAEFETGKFAMMINGDWDFSMLDDDIKAGKSTIKYDVAPLPVPEGVAPGTSHCNDSFISIPTNSKHAEEGWKYAKFLCGEKGAKVMVSTKNFPAYHSDAVKDAYVKATNKSGSDIVFSAKLVQEQPANKNYPDVSTAFNEQSELYLLGEKSLDDAMNTFVQKRANILGKS